MQHTATPSFSRCTRPMSRARGNSVGTHLRASNELSLKLGELRFQQPQVLGRSLVLLGPRHLRTRRRTTLSGRRTHLRRHERRRVPLPQSRRSLPKYWYSWRPQRVLRKAGDGAAKRSSERATTASALVRESRRRQFKVHGTKTYLYHTGRLLLGSTLTHAPRNASHSRGKRLFLPRGVCGARAKSGGEMHRKT